jgi:hypothetical protein
MRNYINNYITNFDARATPVAWPGVERGFIHSVSIKL